MSLVVVKTDEKGNLKARSDADIPVCTIDDYDILEDPDNDLELFEPAQTITADGQHFVLRAMEPLAVLHVLRKFLGGEWWTYDRDAIFQLVEDIVPLSGSSKDRIRALQLLYHNSSFWTEWEVFNWICQALDGLGTDFARTPQLRAHEMVMPLIVANTIATLQGADSEYGEEVVSYVAVSCMEDGCWTLPFPLSIAQNRVSVLWGRKGTNIPVGEVKLLARGDEHIKPEGYINCQALKYRWLRKYRDERVSTAKSEMHVVDEAMSE